MNKELIDKILECNFQMVSKEYLLDLQKLVKEAPNGCIVECGVAYGDSAAVLIANSYKRKVYLCDSYEGFPKPEEIDLHNWIVLNEGDGKGLWTIDNLKSNFDMWNIDYSNVEFIKGYFENSLPELVKTIEPIAFLHFDGDFYKSCITVLDNLYDLIVPGGIIVFHDYQGFKGVEKAVNERFSQDEIIMLEPENCYIIKK